MWVVERNSFPLETQLVEMEPNSSEVPVFIPRLPYKMMWWEEQWPGLILALPKLDEWL